MGQDILSTDQLETVTFNATQSDIKRQSIGSTVRNIANEQICFCGYILNNNDASLVTWVQVFFKKASEVALGTTSPDYTIKIAGGGAVMVDFYHPFRQGTGMSVASTTTETGSTAPATLTTGVFFVKRKPGQLTPS